MNKFRNFNQSGVVLPLLIFALLAVTTSVLAISTFAIVHLNQTATSLVATNALLAAEAGAETTLHQLNTNSSFGGYAETTFFNSSNQGAGTYTTTVTPGATGSQKVITSTGRVNVGGRITTRKVRVIVFGVSAIPYAVQSGPGGLIMENSSTISNGEVFLNGTLTMENTAAIGKPGKPVAVSVAHYSCPTGASPGATFPAKCTSGQPIIMGSGNHIIGTVRANNQTSYASQMNNSGLQPLPLSPPLVPEPMPDFDRQGVIDGINPANDKTGAQASCSDVDDSMTYPANTHIKGSVWIDSDCKITVEGNVWIDGTLDISNSSIFKVAPGVTTPPKIMVDGSPINSNTGCGTDDVSLAICNQAKILSNTDGVGFYFVTSYSTAACSDNIVNANACQVTGNNLRNSMNVVTIQLGNGSLASSSSFYARWSRVFLENSGSVGSLAGQTVHMENSGEVSFGGISGGSGASWSIKSYQQIP